MVALLRNHVRSTGRGLMRRAEGQRRGWTLMFAIMPPSSCSRMWQWYRSAGDAILEERHDQLHFTGPAVSGERNVDGVHHLADVDPFTVAFGDEKVRLMNVEHVMFPGDVPHRPLLDIANLRHRVVPVGGPLLAVDEERVAVRRLREGNHPAADDSLVAEHRSS